MSWKDKIKEWGGGEMAFLSEDGEVLIFVVVDEPVLLEGKYKGKPTEKIGCPVMTDDGFVLFITGKRLARKLSKHESDFGTNAFMAIRRGAANDITSTYELVVLDDKKHTAKLLKMAKELYSSDMLSDAIASAKDVMKQ